MLCEPQRTSIGDLIDAIVDNMRQNLEELKYATLAPSRYTVYLSPAEHARLEGIIPRLQAEAARALNEELARINRPSWLRRQVSWLPGLSGRRSAPLENAGPRWHIEFLATRTAIWRPTATSSSIPIWCWRPTSNSASANAHDASPRSDGRPHDNTREQVSRRRTWRPDGPRGRDRCTRDSPIATISASTRHDLCATRRRSAAADRHFRWTSVVSTSEDVSREHARIRRDTATGQFFLIDLSTLGTTLNGRHVPRGVEVSETARNARTAPRPRCRRAHASVWPTPCSSISSRWSQ